MRFEFTLRTAVFMFFLYIGDLGYSALFAGECAQSSLHPEWLWCDDFEGGKAFKENYQDVDTTGFSISTNDVFEGANALQQHYKTGQVGAGWIIRVNNNGFPDHLFMRWYHKFETGFQGFPPKMARMRFRERSGDWAAPLEIHTWVQNAYVVADVKANSSSQRNSTGWLAVAKSNFSFDNPANVGRWVCFEMEVQLNTPGATDGLYRIWADDSLIVERTKVDLRGSENLHINEVMLDCYWNGGSPKAQSRYYDNFVISTKRIGPVTGLTKSSGSVKKKRSSQLVPSLQKYLRYSDNGCSGVYFTRNNGVSEQEFLLDGKLGLVE
jgi:hypothetical protein